MAVVCQLTHAAALGGIDSALHRLGDAVGIHYDLAVEVAGGAAHGLCQRPVAAQEALFVGIEYSHERHLGQVEALGQ